MPPKSAASGDKAKSKAKDKHTIEDLRLPMTAITRIAKDVLPEGTAFGKDAKVALAKSAAVFILHLTNFSNEFATKGKRKAINGADVLAAVKAMEMTEFEDELKKGQAKFQERKQAKAEAAKKRKSAKDLNTDEEERPASGADVEDDVMVEDEETNEEK
ncbi:hypothetical protein L596_014652 [Steinernema carpocapsae]|uniref:DNA polymerase epsilon subunit 3 n=1 Tax=Steinernema carpocapsae TaxID=34508 RepID=A0A4U5NDN4_STECR|nr:hypothetical protein L596_014652 [Steinernema carpocapsae]